MMCAWKEFLSILPPWIRDQTDRQARDKLQELRLRLDQAPELVCPDGNLTIPGTVSREDLSFVINIASRYSPWASQTIADGYLTGPGGHRIGICGEAVTDHGNIKGIRTVRSVCIRIARDFPGVAKGIPIHGSVLILGPPGSGKTTLLRDLIRRRSGERPDSTAVVDERCEIFPSHFLPGKRVDVLSGCGKGRGISIVLRAMGPGTIAVDEITDPEDACALGQAFGCGVEILATAHGATLEDLYRKPEYKTLMDRNIFQWVVILQRDKSWRTERIT